MQNISSKIQQNFLFKNSKGEYKITVCTFDNNLDLTIEDTKSSQRWRNSFANTYIEQISSKAGKRTSLKVFFTDLIFALKKKNEQKFIDIMSSFDLENIKSKKGGQPSEQNIRSNKQYLILSVKGNQKSHHFPLPLNFVQIQQPQKLKHMIQAIKQQLYECRMNNQLNEKTESIVVDQTIQLQQIKSANDNIKAQIKELEQCISQKQGAVELDIMMRQRMDLQLKVESIKREQNKQILKLKSIYQMKQRQVNELKNEINFIMKQKENGQQNNNQKLRSHMLRIFKINETELNNSKKVIAKQKKEIENINKNILNCKNIEKKLLMKIKQSQIQLDQAKKKANTKQISNRLHSPASSKKLFIMIFQKQFIGTHPTKQQHQQQKFQGIDRLKFFRSFQKFKTQIIQWANQRKFSQAHQQNQLKTYFQKSSCKSITTDYPDFKQTKQQQFKLRIEFENNNNQNTSKTQFYKEQYNSNKSNKKVNNTNQFN